MSCQPACPGCAALRRAALEIVGEGGIDALTVRALSARSGLTAEALTRHYESPAACLHETYAEVSSSVREDFTKAFAWGSSWPDALRLAWRALLQRMASRPAEARLCFVEILRGDRELRCARDDARRLLLGLLAAEHRRRSDREPMPDMQFELLIGAAFQAIAGAVAAGRGGDLAELEDGLAELDGVFEPLAV
jgi:AcrR family transcriptional regulator